MTFSDASAQARLLADLYEQLRAAAQKQMHAERAGHTLTATALVHEAYLRIASGREVPFEERAHFYAAAVEAMRRVLLDHAKARGRAKRGGGRARVDLDAPLALAAADDDAPDVESLDAAIQRLAERDPRMAEVVRLRFYGGLTVEETAALLGVSPRTVKGDWAFARAWLARDLGDGSRPGTPPR